MPDTPTMRICVCGWYLEAFDEWYMSLFRLNARYPVHVVANRNSGYLPAMGLPYTVRDNTGLEWGAYNHYLMRVWPGAGGVLFCHDDIRLLPVVQDCEVYPPEFVFDKIASSGVDQAYVFGSRAEDVENHGQHGRMVFMSEVFLKKAREMGGFWSDEKNRGYISGDAGHLKEEMGCYGYNAGIIRFHAQAETIGGAVHCKMYIPAIDLAKRGVESAKDAYGRYIADIGQKMLAARNKLHVGCGDNAAAGYTNVDLHSSAADVKADARAMPFDDGAFDWVESHHLIEHLEPDGAAAALVEWRRLLSPGGHVFLTCPDIVALTGALAGAENTPELWDGVMGGIYGNGKPGMAHRWGYCRESMARLFTDAGFVNVKVKTVMGYRPTPSLMAIGEKAP